MPAISNLNKAHKQINEQMINHEGPLTLDIAKGFLDGAIKKFNLGEEKVSELKAMKFERPIEEGKLSLEQTVANQATEIDNLKACLSEIATLAGYANYLNKYGLKRTEPAKRK